MHKFKDIGLKLTPQRIAILEFLEGNTDHPSAVDVYRAVSVLHPTMSFATVYNTLDRLRGKGHILELTIDPDKKRFDPCTDPHHHLICMSCKRVQDINMTFNLDLTEQVSGDFKITGNHIEFYGACNVCRNQN